MKKFNPWKDLVVITTEILDNAMVGKGALPSRVFELERRCQHVGARLERMEEENDRLRAEVARLTPPPKDVPEPPDYNTAVIVAEHLREEKAGR